MGWLIAVSAAPVAGPLLYALLHDRPAAVRVVDGFVYLAVPLLVAWQVLPHAWEERTALPLIAVAVGFVVPAALERLSHALERHTDQVALAVGLSGLLVHGVLEGAAFAPVDGRVPVAFALAVVLHRIPVGLVVWWLVRPRYGGLAAAVAIGLVVGTTLAGYTVGMEVMGGVERVGVDTYQAFVSGSLVHVVFHQGRHDHDHEAGSHGH